MNTKFLSAKDSQLQREAVVIDADSKVVGRIASEVAQALLGKNNPQYTPNQDTGSFVVVINADKAVFSGTNKAEKKVYYRHSGYIGGLKQETAAELMARAPEEVIKKSVWGMMPKSTLGRKQFKKLRVYSGAEHPHSAQQPRSI